jgi:hypothetical protein
MLFFFAVIPERKISEYIELGSMGQVVLPSVGQLNLFLPS